MDAATGEWICFVDADDRIAPNHLSLFIQGVSQETDVVYGGIIQRYIDENGKITDNHHVLPGSITEALLDNDNISAPYNVFVRSNLLENIRFNEKYTYGEDAVFKLQLFNKAKSISLIPITGYYYVRNANFCSAVDRYHEKMEDAINKKFELLGVVLEKFGMDKSLISSTIHKMYYDVALVPILTNPFHLGTPLSFWGKYKRIVEDFFSEALPASIYKEINDKNDYNPFCRLLRYGKKLHSCLLVTAVLTLFYR